MVMYKGLLCGHHCTKMKLIIREGTFLIRGWAGASEGRVVSNFFTNWGGSNLFYSQPVEGNSFFGKEKNYSMSLLFCIYKQSYLYFL